MNEGWNTKIAMWRDTTPALRFRPPGISTVVFSPEVRTSWERRDVFGHLADSVPVAQSWTVRMQRQLSVDHLTGELIRAVVSAPQAGTDSLAGAINQDEINQPLSWSIEVVYPNGVGRRFSNIALKKWEILCQSGRAGVEEIEFIALHSEEFDPGTFEEPRKILFKPTSAPFISHSLALGVYTGTDMTNPAAKVPTFSSQIIFDRSIAAVQFDLSGRATRHASGPWDVTGKSMLRLPPEKYIEAIDTAMQASMWWDIGTPGEVDYLRVCLPSARAQVLDQEAVADMIDHDVEFMGTAYRRGLLARLSAHYAALVLPSTTYYYLRPDGVSRYLRPDGVSYITRPPEAMADLILTEEQDALLTASNPAEFIAALVALGLPGNLSKTSVDNDEVNLEYKRLDTDELIGKSVLVT